MRCPSCGHRMIEVAPELYQCGVCGAGPNAMGSNPTWALSFVSALGHYREATCVELKGSGYVAYSFSWEVGDDGRRVGTPTAKDTISLDSSELDEFCLPVVVECARPWELEPASVLRPGMFASATGPKKVIR